MDKNPLYPRRFARKKSFKTGRRSSLRRASVTLASETAALHATLQKAAPGMAAAGAGAGAGAGAMGRQARRSSNTPMVLVDIKITDDTRGFSIDEEQRGWLQHLVDWLVPPCLLFIRTHVKEVVPTQDSTLVNSLLNTLGSAMKQAVTSHKDGYTIGDMEMRGRQELGKPDVECLFMCVDDGRAPCGSSCTAHNAPDSCAQSRRYALMWGFASAADAAGRDAFGEFLRDITSTVSALMTHSLYSSLQQQVRVATPAVAVSPVLTALLAGDCVGAGVHAS